MIHRVLSIAIIGWAIVTASASEVSGVAMVDYHGWKDACRLFNEEAELIVVPDIGRIMRYDLVGTENMLWEESRWAGLDGGTQEWRNFGGDKIWPGPESLWRSVPYRPPIEWDARSHAVEIIGDRSIRMTSPVWAGHGLRIVREITLAKTGAQVTIKNRLERSEEGRALPVFVWTITQVPAPRGVLALIAADAEPAVKNLGRVDLQAVTRPNPEVLLLGWPGKISKAGFMSKALGAWKSEFLFIQQCAGPAGDPARWEPFTQAEVFFKAAPSSSGDSAGYAELEFTSPTKFSSGEPPVDTSIVIWNLLRLPPGEISQEEVARLFQAAVHP